MRHDDLAPAALSRVNGSFDKKLVEQLIADMKEHGWRGRPLLIEEAKYPGLPFPRFHAWTGSHRIEAAREAGLETVPCLVIEPAEADTEFQAAGYKLYWHDGYSCWRDRVTNSEGMNDWDRLQGLERTRLNEATTLLREELAATDGHAG